MRLFLVLGLFLFCTVAVAAPASGASTVSTLRGTAGSDQVVVSGTVPDNATKAAVLSKLRTIYGARRVVDRLAVGGVVTPAQWGRFVSAMISKDLKKVSHGELSVQGNTITLRGEVPDEATRLAVLNKLRRAFNANYAIRQSLHVTQSKQQVLDQTLANRTIEFESGSVVLTLQGKSILDEMAVAMTQLKDPSIQIIGNTDSIGRRDANVRLSLQRAQAVKQYLMDKGIPAADLSVAGAGPDNPIASNDTAEGRARNRRTDFRVASD